MHQDYPSQSRVSNVLTPMTSTPLNQRHPKIVMLYPSELDLGDTSPAYCAIAGMQKYVTR